MRLALLVCCCALSACVATRPLPPSAEWLARVSELQNAGDWRLDGRAAVALGTQGWQATLNWRQTDKNAEVHLAGPFGLGALGLKPSTEGLSLNRAPPNHSGIAQGPGKVVFRP